LSGRGWVEIFCLIRKWLEGQKGSKRAEGLVQEVGWGKTGEFARKFGLIFRSFMLK
jgi:hypothetical protein